MSSGAGPSQGQSACSFPTAHVRIIPSPFDPSPFNRGTKKVHIAVSFNMYWRKAADDENKQPCSLLDFADGNSLQIDRLESNASRNDVENAVKAVVLSDGKPSLVVPGSVHGPSRRGLVRKKVKIELTPDCLQQRDAWLEHIRTRIMPWKLIRQEMKKLHSIMQQNASVGELRKRIQGVVIGGKSSGVMHDLAVPDNPSEEVHEVVTATSRPFSSPRGFSNEAVTKMLGGIPERLQKLDWADKFNVHVNAAIGIRTTGVKTAEKARQAAPKEGISEKVTQVAETAEFVADVSKCVAGVSTAFQLLALSARMLARLAEANRGVLILPGLLDRAIVLLNRQIQSFGIILDVSANVEKFHEDFAFEVLEQTIDVMVLIETQLLRDWGKRFLKAKVVKEIETKMKELRKDVMTTTLIKGSDNRSLVPVHEKHHCRPELSQYFVGRSKELNKLKSILHTHGSAAIAQYGGVGKTELMIALAHSAEIEEEVAGGVFWLTLDGRLNSVVESLAYFVDKLRGVKMAKEDRKDRVLVVAQLKESLSRRKGRWLLCLDNADNEEVMPVLGAVCAIAASSKEKGWVVVTSRLGLPRLWEGMKKEQKVNVQPLSTEDAMILLWRQVHVKDAEEEDDKTVRGKLNEMEEEKPSEYDALRDLCGYDHAYSLGGLPLAVVQSGIYIGRFECSFGEYVELLKETNGKTELNEIFRKVQQLYLVKDAQKSILTTWKLNVNRLSGKAHEVLRSMSMLGHSPIPEPVVAGIVKRSADEGECTKRMMREVFMEELVHGSSLVYRQKTGGREIFDIHRLVRRFILADMERGSELWNKSYENAFLSLRTQIEVMLSNDGNSLDCLPVVFGDQYCHYLPNLFGIIDNYVLSHSAANRLIPTTELYDLARFTDKLSNFLGDQNAVNMWQNVLEALQCSHGTNRASRLIVGAKGLLAIALQKQGKLDVAESIFEECLTIYRDIYGANTCHPDVAATLNDLGWLYESRGKLGAAESMLEECLRMKREIYGANSSHPDVAATLNNLGWLYKSRGKLGAAEIMLEECLRMMRAIYGANSSHPSIAATLNNLGSLYESRGKLGAAECKFEECVRILNDVHGSDSNHPHITIASKNLENSRNIPS